MEPETPKGRASLFLEKGDTDPDHGSKTRSTADSKKLDSRVFDQETMIVLHKLITQKHISDMGGPIAMGKEANVFHASLNDSARVVKIYRIETSSFNNMLPYIQGDPRFQVKNTKRDIVYTWARKEYRNLQRAHEAGVHVPRPYISQKNVLIMSLVGDETAAPMLKNVVLENPQKMFNTILADYTTLYQDAGLVHGDFSEFNVLVQNNAPFLIDFGQAVVHEHPMAPKLLERDMEVFARFFAKKGVKKDPEDLVKSIASAP